MVSDHSNVTSSEVLFELLHRFQRLKKKVWISFVQFDDREIPLRLLGLSGFSDE